MFTRYVLNYGSSWPEPMAVLLMIWFSFMAAAICYREHLHIGVGVLPYAADRLAPRCALGWLVELLHGRRSTCSCSSGASGWCRPPGHQAIAEFPIVSVGMSYLPVPLGGAITLLFVIERLVDRQAVRRAPADGAVSTVSAPNEPQLATRWTSSS